MWPYIMWIFCECNVSLSFYVHTHTHTHKGVKKDDPSENILSNAMKETQDVYETHTLLLSCHAHMQAHSLSK